MANAWTLIATVPSETNPKRSYRISRDAQGRLGCSCPAWVYGTSRMCKHLRARLEGTVIFLPAPKPIEVLRPRPTDLVAA